MKKFSSLFETNLSIMKLVKFIVLFVFAITITSCSDDDPIYLLNQQNLVGTYHVTDLQAQSIATGEFLGSPITITSKMEGSTFNMTYHFNTDSTVVINGSFLVTEHKDINGTPKDTTYIVTKNNEKKTYSINPVTDELTIDSVLYKVHNFNPSGFELTLDQKTTDTTQGLTIETTGKMKLTR